jgi:hypothetical protein
MRLVRMLGLSALVILATMAFIGASPASALTSTALCKKHENPCVSPNKFELLHFTNTAGTVLKILNSIADLLCLNVLTEGHVLALGKPQELHIIQVLLSGCGTDANHNNCTLTFNASQALPWLVSLLRESLNLGTLQFLEFEEMQPTTQVKCTIFGFVKIDCTWDHTGLEIPAEGAGHTAGAGRGMLTANESPVSLKEGSGLCPEESTLDFLLEPLFEDENVYIVE